MTRIVKKPDERRREMIEAAQHLFGIQGYEKTSMQDLMKHLNIAKGTVYHYFASKEALLEAVVETMIDASIEQMQSVLERKGNALRKLQRLIERGNIAAENQEMLKQLHRADNQRMHLRLLTLALAKQAPLYAQVIQQGCKEGIFQTAHPLESAEFILSAVQFLTDVGIYPWSQEDLVRRVRAFPHLIEQQLKAPPGSFQFLITRLNDVG